MTDLWENTTVPWSSRGWHHSASAARYRRFGIVHTAQGLFIGCGTQFNCFLLQHHINILFL